MSARSSVDEIQKAIDGFTYGIPSLDRKQYDKVYGLLKDLSLDSEGKIKPTLENLKIISKVRSQLASFINEPSYQSAILELNVALEKVKDVQTAYFKTTFKDFTSPKTVEKIREISFNTMVDDLAGAGIHAEVVNVSADIVENSIRSGASFSTMVDQLKEKMVGSATIPSKLMSYSKQIINDTMSGFARNYHAIVTNDLDLEWFMYIGSLVASSRPMCIVLVAKLWIHKSELAGISRGIVDGVKVSTEGFMPDTTGENFIYRCAGWNCEHQCVPVPSVVVPKELRDKFEVKIN